MSINTSPVGIVAPSGIKYAMFETEGTPAAIRHDEFYIGNASLASTLAAQGVPVPSKKHLEQLIQAVSDIEHFDHGDIAEAPGWHGQHFIQHDASVIGVNGGEVQVVLRPDPKLIAAKGTLEGWIEHVATPAEAHPLPAFAIMAAFLPAVLRFMPSAPNLVIELVGPAETGKSTVAHLVASVASSPDRIWPLRDAHGHVEQLREAGRDYPLVIDHAEPMLITATKAKKASAYAGIAYDLVRGPGGRVTFLTGRQPLHVACGVGSADDGILTLHVPEVGTGVFGELPDGIAGFAALADSLRAAASAHHGQAYPAFIRAVTQNLKHGPDRIFERLQRGQARFNRLVEKRGVKVTSHKALRAVAAVYAAGHLARQFGILPKSFPCQRAAMAALELCRGHSPSSLPFRERLERLIADGHLVTLDREANPTSQLFAVERALGTLTIKSDRRIIKIAPNKITMAFPDWDRIKRTPEAREVLSMDASNLAVWGKLAPGMERIRLFQFMLPMKKEATLFSEEGAS